MSTSANEKIQGSVSDKGDAIKTVNEVNGLASSNGTEGTDSVVSNIATNMQDYQTVFVPSLPLYSPFTGLDGTWAAGAQYDPNIFASLGYLQQPLYFPGAADIWGQDSTLSNPLMMNYPLLSPVNMEQQQQQQPQAASSTEVSTETSTPVAAPALDQSTLTPSFSGLMLNGTLPGMMAVGPPANLMASVPGTPVENIVATPVGVTPVAVQNTAPQPEKPKSWAAIASQPAKPRPPPPKPVQPEPQVVEISSNPRKSQVRNGSGQNSQAKLSSSGSSGGQLNAGKGVSRKAQHGQSQGTTSLSARTGSKGQHSELVGKLLSENKYNPSDFTMNITNARFFVIKSYAEDDIHRSIKYSIWTSTEHGNRRLDQAYRDQKGKANVYLLFSVNGSGHFCGVAQMMSEVDTNTSTGVWAQDKWKGRFDVKWIYVKDVPNSQLRHIRLENNENKPVTNSRDTQEVPLPKAKQVMKIIHSYQHTTSIFDDFDHYEKKQEEESSKMSLS